MTQEMLISIKEELAKKGKTLSPNSNYFKEYKSTLTGFSESQKERGGDVRIEQTKSGNGHLMKFEWANKEYAHNVYEEFKSYIITPPREQKRINSAGNENVTWCFQTIVHPDIDNLGFLKMVKKCLMIKYMKTLALEHLLVGSWMMVE